MKLYTEGRIKLMEKQEKWVDYNDKAKGKTPIYQYYIQTSSDEGESEVVEIKGTEDYSKLVDVDGIFTLDFYSFFDREKGYTVSGLRLVDARAAKE